MIVFISVCGGIAIGIMLGVLLFLHGSKKSITTVTPTKVEPIICWPTSQYEQIQVDILKLKRDQKYKVIRNSVGLEFLVEGIGKEGVTYCKNEYPHTLITVNWSEFIRRFPDYLFYVPIDRRTNNGKEYVQIEQSEYQNLLTAKREHEKAVKELDELIDINMMGG